MLVQVNKPVTLHDLILLHTTYRVVCVPQQCYSILPDLPDPIKAITEKRKDYSEERIIGYVPSPAFRHTNSGTPTLLSFEMSPAYLLNS